MIAPFAFTLIGIWAAKDGEMAVASTAYIMGAIFYATHKICAAIEKSKENNL